MKNNKTPIWVLIVVIWIFSLSTNPFAQGLLERSFRVKVVVSAEEKISGKIESYIKRELRSLADVTIVEEETDYEISVVAIEDKLESGKIVGITLSVVILDCLDPLLYVIPIAKFFGWTLPGETNMTGFREKLGDFGLDRPSYILDEHWLRTGSYRALRSICEGIVADFDTEILEGPRKLRQEVGEILKTEQKEEK